MILIVQCYTILEFIFRMDKEKESIIVLLPWAPRMSLNKIEYQKMRPPNDFKRQTSLVIVPTATTLFLAKVIREGSSPRLQKKDDCRIPTRWTSEYCRSEKAAIPKISDVWRVTGKKNWSSNIVGETPAKRFRRLSRCHRRSIKLPSRTTTIGGVTIIFRVAI